MTGRGGGTPAVAGGLAPHSPVLLREVLAYLAPRDGGLYIDGTFGAGGYSRAILAAADCSVIGIDRDPTALALARELLAQSGGRLVVSEGRFSDLDHIAHAQGHDAVDGVVLDLGVSSMQLDTAERGFSFRFDGPLDMRMGREGPSAADVVATLPERDLATIIFVLGEERHSRAVARAIVAERRRAPIATTRTLADIVARVVHARPGSIHPATRTFQALRLFVNEELSELAHALSAAEKILRPGGRLVVVSFHSLEDRIVKTFLAERGRKPGASRHAPEIVAEAPRFLALTKKPVTPRDDEITANPRSRSAKLRAAERLDAPARDLDEGALLPRLPGLGDVKWEG